MDFDELLITTGVDKLIKLVKDHKEIELKSAAEILGTPIETVREWAHSLEDEGIIEIKYKLTRSYLKWKEVDKEEIEIEKTSFKNERKKIYSEIKSLDDVLDSEKENLSKLKKGFEEFYKSIYPKLKELDERTKPLEKSEDKNNKLKERYGIE